MEVVIKFLPRPFRSGSVTATAVIAWRRWVVGTLAAVLLAGSAAFSFSDVLPAWLGSASAARFMISAMGRIGLVLAAFCLAWESLQKPARWLPPGIAAAGVVAICVVAAQPRLLLVVVPAIGVLAMLAAILRVFR